MYSTKFDSQATEALYRQNPDDELGQSLDGLSWYGLYRALEAGGGSIVIEDTYGFVGRADFETSEALEEAWCGIGMDAALDALDHAGIAYMEVVGL
ncbi:hypothetical protein LCGC14_1813110 [marine sediment metagenome]|uniref:Uncharacterized protein n=1 Tax=marine sediment metagenome TaxID=412755 RepID=A0A0F9JKS3_9ZZZZ